MVVYGEYLFAENFLMGYLILFLTGKLCARKTRKIKLTIGAVMCGLYAFIIFIYLPQPVELMSRLLFSVLAVGIVYGRTKPMVFVKRVLAFYCVTFALGGCCTGIMYATRTPGFTANKNIYIHLPEVWGVIAGVAAGTMIIVAVIDYLRLVTGREHEILELEICIEGKIAKCKGMVDTANFLVEPVSGKPVSLISRDIMDDVFSDGIPDERMRIVPYQRVGESKLMTVYRCDWIKAGDALYEGGYIGIYEGTFACQESGERYEVLLQRSFFRGESIS